MKMTCTRWEPRLWYLVNLT